ncbi:MAG: hypothetical protein V7L29_34650 [Nostoc sp.]
MILTRAIASHSYLYSRLVINERVIRLKPKFVCPPCLSGIARICRKS